MQGRNSRRWFTAIPITGRFHIMLAILLLCRGRRLLAAPARHELQTEASMDLARVAAVQRSLDRALTLQASIAAELQSAAAAGQSPAALLECAARAAGRHLGAARDAGSRSITDTLRQPAAQYLESAEAYVRRAPAVATDWAFADLEPRRVALESALLDAMTRMRGVLYRVETRVHRGGGPRRHRHRVDDRRRAVRPRSGRIRVLGHRAFHPELRSDSVGEVAQALAAGDMDNRCDVAWLTTK